MGELHYITEAKVRRQQTHALECNGRAIEIMRDRIAKLGAGGQTPDTSEMIRDRELDILRLEQAREYL